MSDPAPQSSKEANSAAPGPSQAQPSNSQQPFVNIGEQSWNEIRKAWTQKAPETGPPPPMRMPIDLDVTTLASSQPFPHPVPLEDVVTCLVDYWENEEYE